MTAWSLRNRISHQCTTVKSYRYSMAMLNVTEKWCVMFVIQSFNRPHFVLLNSLSIAYLCPASVESFSGITMEKYKLKHARMPFRTPINVFYHFYSVYRKQWNTKVDKKTRTFLDTELKARFWSMWYVKDLGRSNALYARILLSPATEMIEIPFTRAILWES